MRVPPLRLPMKRSEWVEQFAAEFTSIPFVREFVFANPQFLKGGLQKEVCDLLAVLRGVGIIGQIKAQEEPGARADEKLERWVAKRADDAAGQLAGALRTMKSNDIWVQHPRRGRVDFPPGSTKVAHAIAIVEVGGSRVQLPDDVPLTIDDVQVTYIDASDFLNLVQQFRSFREICDYLSVRSALPDDVRRCIGGERVLFEFYMVVDATFRSWTTYDAARAAGAERDRRDALFAYKLARDKPASLVEYVADSLASRLPNYTEGLDSETIAMFDADEGRERYLQMQEVLSDLSLVARRQLGEAMIETSHPQTSEAPSPFTYRAIWLDENPEFIFVIAASSGLDRQTVIRRGIILLGGAMAHFKRRNGMLIIDREGAGFEIALVKAYTPNATDLDVGQRFFASLRITDRADRLL